MEEGSTIDGYFGSRQPTIPSNVIILEDPEEAADSSIEPSSSSSQKRAQRRSSISESSEISEIESLPPEYQSRAPSIGGGGGDRQAFFTQQAGSSSLQVPRLGFEGQYAQEPQQQEQRDEQTVQPQQYERREPCTCGHPQCISCSIARRTAQERRGFGSRYYKSRRKVVRFACHALFLLLVFWLFMASWRLRQIYREVVPIDDNISYPDEQPEICRDTGLTIRENFEFTIPFDSSTSFTFEQLVDERPIDLINLRRQVHVHGRTFVRNALDNDSAKDKIRVIIDLTFTDESLRDEIQVGAIDGRVFLKSPRTLPEDNLPACILAKVAIILPHARHKPRLGSFEVLTETLAISIEESVSLETSRARFRTIAASISSAMNANGHAVSTNDLSVSSISGAIRGDWGVGQKVSWDTKSGAIRIGLFPSKPTSAKYSNVSIEVHSISGAIYVSLVGKNKILFDENVKTLNTEVSSSSSSVTGQYILGTSLTVTTVSGRIDADVIPIAPGKSEKEGALVSRLRSDTKSGRTSFHFLNRKGKSGWVAGEARTNLPQGQSPLRWIIQEPRRLIQYFKNKCPKNHKLAAASKDEVTAATPDSEDEDDAVAILVDESEKETHPVIIGSHKSISGAVNLHYPCIFDGTITAKSLTSSVQVGGEGVEIVRKKHGWPVGNEVEAVKGDSSAGKIEVETVSGRIDLAIP